MYHDMFPVHYRVHCMHLPGTCIGYPDPVVLHSPACLRVLSPASCSLCCSLNPSSTSIPTASHRSRLGCLYYSGELSASIFAPSAVCVDKNRLSLTLPCCSLLCSRLSAFLHKKSLLLNQRLKINVVVGKM